MNPNKQKIPNNESSGTTDLHWIECNITTIREKTFRQLWDEVSVIYLSQTVTNITDNIALVELHVKKKK